VTLTLVAATLALAIWIYLTLFRGGFWLARERDDVGPAPLTAGGDWPSVAVVIPARDEALMLPRSLGSILAQAYPGRLSIVVVDDESSDGTAEVARTVAADGPREVAILEGKALPPSWTGKIWALEQGVAHAEALKPQPDYLLLTDADIEYAPDALKRLVARASAGKFVLTSLMAKLHCESLAERALIPAFVFFFQMLYPFAWVNHSTARTAAAAGGCMLVETSALERAGGIAKIKGALIDDCALAQLMKGHGPISLRLSEDVRSIRLYPHLGDIGRMVSRSAYAQLGYSPLLLAGTVIGMVLTYLTAPFLAVFGSFPVSLVAAATWALMTLTFLPILRFYRLSPLWAAALPLIAMAYVAFTLNSAYQHWWGAGGMWKGRSQALALKR
jgi:hopene-associated glycosyltransferase HpnB